VRRFKNRNVSGMEAAAVAGGGEMETTAPKSGRTPELTLAEIKPLREREKAKPRLAFLYRSRISIKRDLRPSILSPMCF
jgi:hypothetical protein